MSEIEDDADGPDGAATRGWMGQRWGKRERKARLSSHSGSRMMWGPSEWSRVVMRGRDERETSARRRKEGCSSLTSLLLHDISSLGKEGIDLEVQICIREGPWRDKTDIRRRTAGEGGGGKEEKLSSLSRRGGAIKASKPRREDILKFMVRSLRSEGVGVHARLRLSMTRRGMRRGKCSSGENEDTLASECPFSTSLTGLRIDRGFAR